MKKACDLPCRCFRECGFRSDIRRKRSPASWSSAYSKMETNIRTELTITTVARRNRTLIHWTSCFSPLCTAHMPRRTLSTDTNANPDRLEMSSCAHAQQPWNQQWLPLNTQRSTWNIELVSPTELRPNTLARAIYE